jgi:phosphoglycerate kinase
VTVTDTTRLQSILPTTRFLLDRGANVILCSHFGRPPGEIIETGKHGRLNPVVQPLEALLGRPIQKMNDCVGLEVEAAAHNLTEGDVVLLENTRFHKGETKNDDELSQGLGKLADYFVMDAFGTYIWILLACSYSAVSILIFVCGSLHLLLLLFCDRHCSSSSFFHCWCNTPHEA